MDKLVKEFKMKTMEITGDPQLRMILFGSRSRRNFTRDSDYDLLIITDKKDSRILHAIENLEIELFLSTSAIFNSHVFTPYELETMHYEPFIMNALREGKAA
jgi:predicted nucleotidyltransferase